jgi:hypothetical protein
VEAGGTTLTGVQCGNSSGWQLLKEFERSERRLHWNGFEISHETTRPRRSQTSLADSSIHSSRERGGFAPLKKSANARELRPQLGG